MADAINDEVDNCAHVSMAIFIVNLSALFSKSTIYLLISCNIEEKIAQNIHNHNSNKNYRKARLSIYNCNNNNLVADRLIKTKNIKSNAQDSSFA